MTGSERCGKSGKHQRSTKRRTEARRRPAHEWYLFDDARRLVAEPSPVSMLSNVSALMVSTEPPRGLPFAGPTEPDAPRCRVEGTGSVPPQGKGGKIGSHNGVDDRQGQ